MLSRRILRLSAVLCFVCPVFFAGRLHAEDNQVFPAAIFGFEERGIEAKGVGIKASDLLFAELVTNSDFPFVVFRINISH